MGTKSVTFFISQVKVYRWRYLLILGFEFLQATSGILTPLVFGLLIESITQRSQASREQGALLIVFLMLIVMDMLFSRFSGGLYVRTIALQRHSAVESLYGKVLGYSHQFFLARSSGFISHRIAETSIAVNQLLGCVIFDFWPTAVALCAAAVMLSVASPWLGAFMLAWLIVYFAGSFHFAKRGAGYAAEASRAENETNGKISDVLENHLIVSLFQGLCRERSNLRQMLAGEMRYIRRANHYFEGVRWAQFAAMTVLAVTIVSVSFFLYERDSVGVALLAMSVGLILNIINYTHNLSQRLADFFDFWGRLTDGVSNLMSHEQIEACDCTRHDRISNPVIRFERVGFSFESGREIIHDLSIDIPAGQRIGIVGASGAGKSTLLALLLRLHSPRQGKIYFGEKDIQEICVNELRQNISVVPQESLIFNRSIFDNIHYGSMTRNASAVREAVTLASAQSFIEALDKSYGSVVGADGVTLSGGERQRIAIARALIKAAPVLVLDEATANLDPLTEDAVRDAVLNISRATTVLVVAHRLRVVAALDRIIVLDNGTVVEDGAHEELLARNGLYRKLWEVDC